MNPLTAALVGRSTDSLLEQSDWMLRDWNVAPAPGSQQRPWERMSSARSMLRGIPRTAERELRWWTGLLRGYSPYDLSYSAILRYCEEYIKREFPKVYACQLASRSDGGLVGGYQFCRLWEIDRILRAAKPESVLELGCGTSSAMFASHMVSPTRFVTVEQSAYWLDRMLAASGDLRESMTPKLAATRFFEFGGEPVVHYELEDESRYYDMVYVDGPYNVPPSDLPEHLRRRAFDLEPNGGNLACVDVELMWCRGLFPRIIVVDGRESTLRRLRRVDAGRYDFSPRSRMAWRLSGKLPDYFLYHSVIVRRAP